MVGALFVALWCIQQQEPPAIQPKAAHSRENQNLQKVPCCWCLCVRCCGFPELPLPVYLFHLPRNGNCGQWDKHTRGSSVLSLQLKDGWKITSNNTAITWCESWQISLSHKHQEPPPASLCALGSPSLLHRFAKPIRQSSLCPLCQPFPRFAWSPRYSGPSASWFAAPVFGWGLKGLIQVSLESLDLLWLHWGLDQAAKSRRTKFCFFILTFLLYVWGRICCHSYVLQKKNLCPFHPREITWENKRNVKPVLWFS